ncbi:MAG: DUF4446 family protein [Candidatus Blackburnbacteria bacterium]|nr:DUF4446 family protein [Candidatus Blackburnbacteria bacterium]
MVLSFVIVALWLLGLTVWVYRATVHCSRLTGSSDKKDLKTILDNLLLSSTKTSDHVKDVELKMAELGRQVQKHIQKIGVVRFNPFGDTGGNQSFAIAFLDGQDSGVVVLSLHGREGTRVYVKNVKEGVSSYELSKEEAQAVEQARKR